MITNIPGANPTGQQLLNGCNVLSRPTDEFVNDERLEYAWAEQAFDYAEVHYNILASVDTKFLHLTPTDDVLYSLFREEFPNLKIDVLDVDYIKSTEQKKAWREFCDKFKETVPDYNFATLIRINCGGMYNEENTILVPRIQFYAIEIARNKEGYNASIRKEKKIAA